MRQPFFGWAAPLTARSHSSQAQRDKIVTEHRRVELPRTSVEYQAANTCGAGITNFSQYAHMTNRPPAAMDVFFFPCQLGSSIRSCRKLVPVRPSQQRAFDASFPTSAV